MYSVIKNKKKGRKKKKRLLSEKDPRAEMPPHHILMCVYPPAVLLQTHIEAYRGARSLDPALLSLMELFEYSYSGALETPKPATAPKTVGNPALTINRPNKSTTPPQLLWVILSTH